MLKLNTLTTLAVFAIAVIPALSQAQTINHRLDRQHSRIHQGVKSGSLTRREAGVVRSDDRFIHSEERFDRSRDHGHLTNGERRSLNRQLNRNSGRIYRLKHNDVNRKG